MSAVLDSLWMGGVAIVGLVLLQTLWLTIGALRRSAHQSVQRKRELELLDLKIAAARQRGEEEERKSLTWTGWRKFEVKKKHVEDGQRQVCSFYLEPHDGKRIPSFSPGQFLTFELQIAGQSRPTVRCYSLSDAPGRDYYRVSIKRCPPPRKNPDAPPGLSSNFFHDQVNEGDILDVRAPGGAFFLDLAADSPVVLIGGGIGVTPVLSMLKAITDAGGNRKAWFFYGIRNKGEYALRDEVETIAREYPNVELRVCYSSPGPDDREGIDYHHNGRVDLEYLKKTLPSSNFDFYLCGPPPMMQSLDKGLAEWGVPEENVHMELFGPASVKKEKKTLDSGAKGPEVKFRKSGKSAHWDPNADHLWEFARANDIDIASGCLQGNCGSCETAILSGEVEYAEKPAYDCEAGSCLVCCSVPKGPLELDA